VLQARTVSWRRRELRVIPHHLTVNQAIIFVERHGYALLFFWVLAEQSAIPIPSAPLLLAAGALIRAGRLNAVIAITCCVAAALIADTLWFQLGRSRGRSILKLLCRVSLEPDSCVRQTENAFVRYGMRSLLVSKFIPGLNAVAAPLAGNSKASFGEFLMWDASGTALWSGAYFAAGYLFSAQLELLLAYGSRMGSSVLLLVAAFFALWLVRKYVQRRLFLRRLRVDRITPEELQERLRDGEDLVVLDLRSGVLEETGGIPGAIRLSPEELSGRAHEIPRDREIILFCS
jgi:membrane protein DedA with SNARE-associated domain